MQKGELTQDDFISIVNQFGLICKYNFTEIDDKKMIIEEWVSKFNPHIKLNRIYPFIKENYEIIPLKERKKLLKVILNNAVEIENYEEAAKIRDILTELG